MFQGDQHAVDGGLADPEISSDLRNAALALLAAKGLEDV
jgi:hypothetical protein